MCVTAANNCIVHSTSEHQLQQRHANVSTQQLHRMPAWFLDSHTVTQWP